MLPFDFGHIKGSDDMRYETSASLGKGSVDGYVVRFLGSVADDETWPFQSSRDIDPRHRHSKIAPHGVNI